MKKELQDLLKGMSAKEKMAILRDGLTETNNEVNQAKQEMSEKIKADKGLTKLVEGLGDLDFSMSVIIGGYDVKFSPVKVTPAGTAGEGKVLKIRVTHPDVEGGKPVNYISLRDSYKGEMARRGEEPESSKDSAQSKKWLKAEGYTVERHDAKQDIWIAQ